MTKEEIKAKRKEAYLRAKAQRDNDPNYLALKEKLKIARRAKYRAYVEKQKAKIEALRIKRQQMRDDELAESFGLKEKLTLLKFD